MGEFDRGLLERIERFAPLLDDHDGAGRTMVWVWLSRSALIFANSFAARLFEALDAAEEPLELDIRVRREHQDVSAIFAIWAAYRSTFYVRRCHLPKLRTWLASTDLGKEYADRQQALLEHVDRLLAPASCAEPG